MAPTGVFLPVASLKPPDLGGDLLWPSVLSNRFEFLACPGWDEYVGLAVPGANCSSRQSFRQFVESARVGVFRGVLLCCVGVFRGVLLDCTGVFHGVLPGCVGVFCGVLLGGPGGLVFVLLPSTVMFIFVSPPWVGRGGNPGGGRENVLDGFGFALAATLFGASWEAFLSTALYDIEVAVLSSWLVSTELRVLTDSTGGGGDRPSLFNKSLAWSVIVRVSSSRVLLSVDRLLSALLTNLRDPPLLYGIPPCPASSFWEMIFFGGEILGPSLSWLPPIKSC